MEGPRRRHRRRPAGSPQVVEVQRRRLAEGRQRLLLRPLRGAEGRRDLHRRQQVPEAVLPQARHVAGPGHAGLRAQGSARLDVQRRRHRGRPLPDHRAERRHEAREPRLRQGPLEARRRRSCRSSTSSTPNTTSSATTASASTCRPTRMRRAAAWSRIDLARPEPSAWTRRDSRGRGPRRAERRRRWSTTASSRSG